VLGLRGNDASAQITRQLMRDTEPAANPENVFTIFATNLPQNVDPALRSRLEMLPVWLPTELERAAQLKLGLERLVEDGQVEKSVSSDAFQARLASMTKWWSGRDIQSMFSNVSTQSRKDARVLSSEQVVTMFGHGIAESRGAAIKDYQWGAEFVKNFTEKVSHEFYVEPAGPPARPVVDIRVVEGDSAKLGARP
jgi:AAA+ superfamily predicted ATPase